VGAEETGARSWRDDHDFAAIVGPLARNLRWRVRVGRLVFGSVGHPVLRAAGNTGAVLALATATVICASVLVLTVAGAYATPVRWSLGPFG
jgi:hypothetical protein